MPEGTRNCFFKTSGDDFAGFDLPPSPCAPLAHPQSGCGRGFRSWVRILRREVEPVVPHHRVHVDLK
jgi:hypothetical protein